MRVCLLRLTNNLYFPTLRYLRDKTEDNGFQPKRNRIAGWEIHGRKRSLKKLTAREKTVFHSIFQHDNSRLCQAYSAVMKRNDLENSWSGPDFELTWKDGKVNKVRLKLRPAFRWPYHWSQMYRDSKNPAKRTIRAQVLIQFRSSFIVFEGSLNVCFFIDKIRKRVEDEYDEFRWDFEPECFESEKSVSKEIIQELKSIQERQLWVAIYGLFDDPPELQRPNEVLLNFAESNWRVFTDECFCDLTIVSNDWKLTGCHKVHFARQAVKLSEKLNDSNSNGEPVNVLQLDLSGDQVVAFLRYQYSLCADMILESSETSLTVLKVSEHYEMWELWKDVVDGLLQKESRFFGDQVATDLGSFLTSCVRNNDENVRILQEKVNERIQFTKENPDDMPRRSIRVKQRPQKRSSTEIDESWKDALQRGEESETILWNTKVSKNGNTYIGPRDILKAPGLNKISISQEFKVEKEEPTEKQFIETEDLLFSELIQ